jgi:hypothetical protein
MLTVYGAEFRAYGVGLFRVGFRVQDVVFWGLGFGICLKSHVHGSGLRNRVKDLDLGFRVVQGPGSRVQG